MSFLGPIFIRTLIILVLISILKVGILDGKCPSKVHSWCLQIDGYDNVILDGNRFNDVKKVFRQISVFFNDTESKEFDQFLLYNNQEVKQLEENTFSDFTFKNIIIKNCTKLVRIDPEAFNGTNNLINRVYIDLVSITPNNVQDFFESLNSLTKLQELELFNHNIIRISPFAFRQLYLNKLELDGPIDIIENNAFFHLDNLRILKLFKSINRIQQHAFDFKSATNKTLDIYFDIKLNIVERGVFSHVQRPITLNLFLNKLKNFDEGVYEEILMSDIRHDIIFHGELKEMSRHCILDWLFRNKDRFKGKFSFKTDPNINEEYFNDCNNIGLNEPTSDSNSITQSPINSSPYISVINRNLITILSSLLYFIMLSF